MKLLSSGFFSFLNSTFRLLPSPSSSRSAHHPRTVRLCLRLLEVTDDIGEGHHAIASQYIGKDVRHSDIGDGSADAVVLVE